MTAGFPLWEQAESLDRWDDIPVLPSTVLGLELLLKETVIDLRQTSGLILSDLGATLHTLRMACCDDTVPRVEDCLAALEVSAWFDALTARRMPPGPESRKAAAAWHHATDIARYARFVAESMENLLPDTAYLVGLFHELSALPRTLGWTTLAGTPLENALPAALATLVAEAQQVADSPWRYVVDAAHQLTSNASTFCPLIRFSSSEIEVR